MLKNSNERKPSTHDTLAEDLKRYIQSFRADGSQSFRLKLWATTDLKRRHGVRNGHSDKRNSVVISIAWPESRPPMQISVVLWRDAVHCFEASTEMRHVGEPPTACYVADRPMRLQRVFQRHSTSRKSPRPD